MDTEEKMIVSKDIYNGKVIHVTLDDVTVPGGGTAKREIVHHRGGVCCAPMNEKGELAFVRQFRYAYGEMLLELPAGKLETSDTDTLSAIKRELREEIGGEGEDWRDMGKLYPTPGYCTEIIHLYTCNVRSIGETHFDPDEFLETVWIPLDKAVDMVMRGEIRDSKTQVLVLKLAMEKRA